MSKTLLLAAFAGAMMACTITINGSGSEGNSSSQNTDDGPGSGHTSDDPSATTTNDAPTTESPTTASATTTDIPTTGAPSGESSTGEPVLTGTTDDPSTSTSSETGTDTGSEGSSTADTTTDSGHGMCGWNVDKTYYACPDDGGVPGVADPKNNYPIDCRDQELKGGSPCGMVGPAGCCTPTGDLFYCGDDEMPVEQNCGV